jgi:hypothetical protein
MFRSPTHYSSDSFVQLRQSGVWFADRTHLLRWIDGKGFPSHAIIRCPPRFGKSFWLRILDIYYDVLCPEEVFQFCFGALRINGEHPHERYLMLVIDLSTAKLDPFNHLVVETTLLEAINLFVKRYQSILQFSLPVTTDVFHLL